LLVKVVQFYHTIKFLKLKQIVWRIFNFFPRFIKASTIFPEVKVISIQYIIKTRITADFDSFNFLNEIHQLSKVGWDNTSLSKLWRYNIHYFDFLRQEEQTIDVVEIQKKIIHNWISENNYGKGTGWEPYPTSLRIINWIKWHSKTNGLTDEAKLSLWNQLLWLSARPEYHLLGNHLFVNAKAMLFGCAFFGLDSKSSIYRSALKILICELDEQFLDDGAHFELSPMYHALAMEDLLDLYQLSSVLPANFPSETIKSKFNHGMNWLSLMRYENDELSHFNDCANNVAPNFKDLESLGKSLGIEQIFNSKSKFTYSQQSGFAIFKTAVTHLIADIGQIGPDYLPGHAHADSLSFELAIKGTRVIINSGTSEYGISSERLRQRSTSAHSTIEVDGQSSSEVWSGFRVARRASISEIKINENNQFVEFSGVHDGYSRLAGSPKHFRKWKVSDDCIEILDEVSGNKNIVHLRFYFHPDVMVEKQESFIILRTLKNKLVRISSLYSGEILNTTYHDNFGSSQNNKCLLITGITPFFNQVTISWDL